MNKYTREEVYNESIKYFNGDTLATDVWINKYSLKDSFGNIYEKTPIDMHRRLSSELYRIESKYLNPLSEEKIFGLIKDFKYIVPQGGPMSGIGNTLQTISLSNCFVVGNTSDSYGGLLHTDQEQVQLMKRRGGVGHDLSHIRPKGSPVKNSALTSTGVVPFMERFSNSTREVAQDGRRGALMLSISIKHPDAEDFIDAKLEAGKVTGANISVKLSDEFMECVRDGKPFTQQYPIDSDNPMVSKEVDAQKLWKKIVYNAWKSAEPGLMFWDNITREAIPDCYSKFGFKTVSTNPCGEIPLNPYDSCRLLAINLFSYVIDPFTKDAKFNFDLLAEHTDYAQRFMDDIVDLEIEKIDAILEKIKTDPETDDVKRIEIDLWTKIKEKALQGRRTGLGITSEGDMLAALGLIYGTDEATKFSTEVHKHIAVNAYKTTIDMAKERGSFEVWDWELEKDNPFIQRIYNELSDEYKSLLKEHGRRNIALLTIAPTGTVSLMTQTTSGIEPVFQLYYKRNRKVNPNDKDSRVDFVDEIGDAWESYNVFHPKFFKWLKINDYNIEKVKLMSNNDIAVVIEKTPWAGATSADVDWLEKVKMQGEIQKWIDHSISVTINLPSNTTVETVDELYKTAWKCGCKGLTIYRDGCRTGVLIKSDKTIEEYLKENNAQKRPKTIKCEIVTFVNNKEKWIGFLGIYEENEKDGEKYPYELFTGLLESFPIPNYVENGWIKKSKNKDGKSSYNFVYLDRDGYEVIMGGLNRAFNREFWNTSKMISAMLRHKIHLPTIINLVDSLKINGKNELDYPMFGTWQSGVKRILKKYIKTINTSESCQHCGSTNLIRIEGCLSCVDCQWSQCSD